MDSAVYKALLVIVRWLRPLGRERGDAHEVWIRAVAPSRHRRTRRRFRRGAGGGGWTGRRSAAVADWRRVPLRPGLYVPAGPHLSQHRISGPDAAAGVRAGPAGLART